MTDFKDRKLIILLIIIILGVVFFVGSLFSKFDVSSHEARQETGEASPLSRKFLEVPSTDDCYYQFVEYRPSELEEHWFKASLKFTGKIENYVFCEEAKKHLDWAKTWVKLVEEMMNKTWRTLPTTHQQYQVGTKIFSKFFHREVCNGTASKELRETWIEPLAFTLRDPRWLCIDTINLLNYLLTREWILLDQQEKKPQHSQNFYFDLGASTFNEGGGGPSQLWFYMNYKQRNIQFDRQLLWEGIPTSPTTLFEQVPDDWISGYQYFNILAVVDDTSPRNPLMILKKIAKSKDFVMFKLDIDNGPIEMSLIKQIESNPQYSSLIDEFFFEHHVAFQPLLGCWGATHDPNSTLRTSYELFTNFRKKGIRAHGWP